MPHGHVLRRAAQQEAYQNPSCRKAYSSSCSLYLERPVAGYCKCVHRLFVNLLANGVSRSAKQVRPACVVSSRPELLVKVASMSA